MQRRARVIRLNCVELSAEMVLFDNECPECHVDCSEYNDCTKEPIEEKWLCNNCGWIGDRNTKGVESS